MVFNKNPIACFLSVPVRKMILNVEEVKTLVNSIEKISQWMDREENKTANRIKVNSWSGWIVDCVVSLAYSHSHNNYVTNSNAFSSLNLMC